MAAAASAGLLLLLFLRAEEAPLAADGPTLTSSEVQRIVSQTAAAAAGLGLRAHIAVVGQEGHVLARFKMAGAGDRVVIRPTPTRAGVPGHGLEAAAFNTLASFIAVTKAGTGAFLSSGGNAFSTRTAGFIVQDHFPPLVEFTPGGPLFGVQFSSLPCTDFKSPFLPAGLSADPGGIPLYKGGRVAGGLGVEADGVYTLDPDPADDDVSLEERAALLGARGFDAPDLIRADNILADGIRLPYVNSTGEAVSGAVSGQFLDGPRDGPPSAFSPTTAGGETGEFDPRFPTRGGQFLTASDVATILAQAAQQASRTRGAIRQPLGSKALVSIVVVDLDGTPLGNFRNADAPVFGFDVAVQKARTANFFSGAGAADDLRRAGLGKYLGDGVPLDGSVAFTSRAVGFLSQPFYPPGIEEGAANQGPFSSPTGEWSPFNTGLQFDLISSALGGFLANADRGVLAPPGTCSAAIPRLKNGITIFPGGVPLYKNGRLVGAIGVSGDGVDQDDLIASGGAAGFDAPPERRCDRLTIRGVRLPYVKFPRHPEL